MKAVIQRVNKASVTIEKKEKREISRGIALFLGITHSDTENDAKWLAEKCLNLRIFPDDSGAKLDRSVMDIKGDILIVSQFTLYGDCLKGRRPDFVDAAKPELAEPLYRYFVKVLCDLSGIKVVTGEFKTEMLVEIHNDGPVTIIVDSKLRNK